MVIMTILKRKHKSMDPTDNKADEPLSHNELAANLARYLRGDAKFLCFMDVEVGDCEGYDRAPRPQWDDEKSYETYRKEWDDYKKLHPWSGRPDVFAINNQSLETRAYEVKVQRSDFLGDIRSGKWRRYLCTAGQVFFAVPEGIIEHSEVPKECGLIVREQLKQGGNTYGHTWQLRKRAPKHHDGKLSFNQCFKLLRGCHSQITNDQFRKNGAV